MYTYGKKLSTHKVMSINGKQYQWDMLQLNSKLIESLEICNLIANHVFLRGGGRRDMQKT